MSEATINIIKHFGSCRPITYKWLLGNLWTLLAQCCWWGVVFSEKAFQHSGRKQQWTQYKGECLFLVFFVPASRNAFSCLLLHPSWDWTALPLSTPFVGPDGSSHHYGGRFLHLGARQCRGCLAKPFTVIYDADSLPWVAADVSIQPSNRLSVTVVFVYAPVFALRAMCCVNVDVMMCISWCVSWLTCIFLWCFVHAQTPVNSCAVGRRSSAGQPHIFYVGGHASSLDSGWIWQKPKGELCAQQCWTIEKDIARIIRIIIVRKGLPLIFPRSTSW